MWRPEPKERTEYQIRVTNQTTNLHPPTTAKIDFDLPISSTVQFIISVRIIRRYSCNQPIGAPSKLLSSFFYTDLNRPNIIWLRRSEKFKSETFLDSCFRMVFLGCRLGDSWTLYQV